MQLSCLQRVDKYASTVMRLAIEKGIGGYGAQNIHAQFLEHLEKAKCMSRLLSASRP
jgi:hypothetical protein